MVTGKKIAQDGEYKMKKRRIRLKIGYRDYILRYVKRLSSRKIIGECEKLTRRDLSDGKIWVKSDLDDIERLNTEWHEIGHAICSTQGIDMSDKVEERFVHAYTNGQIQFMKENKEYMKGFLKEIWEE